MGLRWRQHEVSVHKDVHPRVQELADRCSGQMAFPAEHNLQGLSPHASWTLCARASVSTVCRDWGGLWGGGGGARKKAGSWIESCSLAHLAGLGDWVSLLDLSPGTFICPERSPFLEKIILKSSKWSLSYLLYQWDSQLPCPYWKKSLCASLGQKGVDLLFHKDRNSGPESRYNTSRHTEWQCKPKAGPFLFAVSEYP